ncbi:MAG TPA: hypothetical protein VNX18_20620 [Bryobacteraceae bacterium]|jgi:hypothetical protein|nr:hypothetical protein [Bryobacteraceae bacterium]
MRPALFLLPLLALAQDAPPPELNAAEKQFQDAMVNVKLVGYYTLGDSSELHDDSYVIEKVTKIKEDTWKIEAKILYNKKDFKVAMNLPVKFAGDTPVISLTDFTVPGFGKFTARVVLYNGTYAGTWSGAGAGHGGAMFGKIVKNEAAPAPQ